MAIKEDKIAIQEIKNRKKKYYVRVLCNFKNQGKDILYKTV